MNCMASTMNFDKFRIRHAFFNIFNIRKNFSSYSPFIKRTGILSFSAHPTMKAEPRSHAPQAICEPFWVVSKSFFSHRFLYVFAKRFCVSKAEYFPTWIQNFLCLLAQFYRQVDHLFTTFFSICFVFEPSCTIF